MIKINPKCDYTKKEYSKKLLPYLTTNDDIKNIVYVRKENTHNSLIYILRFGVNSSCQNYHSTIKANSSLPITIELPNKINFNSFIINNVDYINKFVNNSYTIYPRSNETLNISFKANVKTDKNISLYQNISLISFIITFFIFLICMQCILTRNILKKLLNNYQCLIIFLSFFIFYMLNNHYAIYNTCYSYVCNIYWGGDTTWSIQSIMYSISRIKHSFFFLPFYPIFDILLLITKNITFSLMIIFSSISALSVACLYKLLNIITPNKQKLTLLLTLIFGFSYTMMSIYYTFEVYSITGLYLILLITLLIKEFKTKEYNYINMFYILLLITLFYGVSSSNIFTSLILILGIFIYKKNKKSIIIFSLILLLLISAFKSFVCLTSSQNAWTSAKIFSSKHMKWVKPNKTFYIKNVLKYPLIAQNTKYSNQSVKIFFMTILLLNILSMLILLNKQDSGIDKQVFKIVNIALVFNLIAHYYWFPIEGFLFSQNFFALWFVNIAYCLHFIEQELQAKNLSLNNVLTMILLLIFLGIELPNNYISGQNYQITIMQKYPLTHPILEIKR